MERMHGTGAKRTGPIVISSGVCDFFSRGP
jgi:hypothetical protein